MGNKTSIWNEVSPRGRKKIKHVAHQQRRTRDKKLVRKGYETWVSRQEQQNGEGLRNVA